MTTKEKIIYILEENKGKAVSGQALAEQLNITRAAVWKAIKDLQKNNYDIQAITNVGYTLNTASDILTQQAVISGLTNKNVTVIAQSEVTSTNTIAKELAAQGANHASVVVSGSQTKGRGRMGREFKSPQNTGLYLSVILRGEMSLQNSMYVTSAAAVAVVRSLKNKFGINNMRIKWVNDLYINSKKAGGILCEAVTDMQTGKPAYIIVGIGLNLYTPQGGFEKEIQNIATSIFNNTQRVSRASIASAIVNELVQICDNLPNTNFINEYKSLNIVPGKNITVHQNGAQYTAHALNISNDGFLTVRLNDGSEKQLSFGEVSIKL